MPGSGSNPTDAIQLRQRLKWVSGFRFITAAIFVTATLLWRPDSDDPSSKISFLIILGTTLVQLLVTGSFFLTRHVVPDRFLVVFSYVQLVWDLLFATIFSYVTGGIQTQFEFTYWLTIITSSIVLFRKGAFTSAVLSAIFYGTLVDLEYWRIIPVFYGSGEPEDWVAQRVIASIVLNTAGFFIVAYVASFINVRLRHAETMLAEKSSDLENLENLMGRIVDSLTSGLVTVDSQGRISFWSHAAEDITGLKGHDVRGKLFQGVFPESKNLLQLDRVPSSDRDRPWRWEMNYKRPDLSDRTLGFSVSALKDQRVGEKGTLIIFQDLTHFRTMEEQVKRADRLAAVGELAARMAHEIRNPLTSVSGSIEMLRNQMNLQDRDRKLMDIVLRETDRLNQLLTDFLLFARPQLPQIEEVRVDQLLRETVELFSKSRSDGKVKISMEGDHDVVLQGDAKQLSQMFWNLMKNASEAMTQGGDLRVKLLREDPNGKVVIEVMDQGSGIEAHVLKKIFQPFFTTKTRGTGLGLAMVKRIAEDHGGSISVESRPGNGSVFRVIFPQIASIQGAV